MPLSSLLERFRRGANGTTPGARAPSPSDVEALRTRARRRLIGMVVLVGAGIIGFPWLFETQPRPMSQDVEMVRGGVDTADSADSRAARSVETVRQVAMIRVPTPRDVPPAPDEVVEEIVSTAPPVRASSAAEEVSKPVVKAEPKVEPKVEHKVVPSPALKAEPKVESKPTKVTDADRGRFVVQFGAFSDGITAHQARMKVERLGIKTYTQEVKTPQGTRIRVRMGPYANRAEAEKVLASLRKAGLSGAVLTL